MHFPHRGSRIRNWRSSGPIWSSSCSPRSRRSSNSWKSLVSSPSVHGTRVSPRVHSAPTAFGLAIRRSMTPRIGSGSRACLRARFATGKWTAENDGDYIYLAHLDLMFWRKWQENDKHEKSSSYLLSSRFASTGAQDSIFFPQNDIIWGKWLRSMSFRVERVAVYRLECQCVREATDVCFYWYM